VLVIFQNVNILNAKFATNKKKINGDEDAKVSQGTDGANSKWVITSLNMTLEWHNCHASPEKQNWKFHSEKPN